MDDNSKQIAERQFQMALAWAAHWNAKVISGAYKNRNVRDGHGTPWTEQQLLDDAINTSKRHLLRAEELLDFLG